MSLYFPFQKENLWCPAHIVCHHVSYLLRYSVQIANLLRVSIIRSEKGGFFCFLFCLLAIPKSESELRRLFGIQIIIIIMEMKQK